MTRTIVNIWNFTAESGIDMTFNANLRFKSTWTSGKNETKSNASETQFGAYYRAATRQG